MSTEQKSLEPANLRKKLSVPEMRKLTSFIQQAATLAYMVSEPEVPEINVKIQVAYLLDIYRDLDEIYGDLWSIPGVLQDLEEANTKCLAK